MTPPLSDLRLARRASDGDRRAFEAIYRRYHQAVYRFCLSILRRPEDAQDALQNTMLKAMRALPGEQREIKLKPWLYRVAHNESIDLLRRRHDGPELDSRMSAGPEIAETVEMRERLGRLLADLEELPERQRSALIMRELGGLDYEQIGEAFESSSAVARQTVYEARLGLRELETGREMGCEEVTRQLSEADGRVMRRRDIRAHLRTCPECRAFHDSIKGRRRDFAALVPLPAALAASILHGLAGGKAAVGGGGLGGAATAAGAGAGKAAGTSVAIKAVATVAVAATVGVTAADRSGLVDVGLPGGSNDKGTKRAAASGGPADRTSPASGSRAAGRATASRSRAELDAAVAALRAKDGGTRQPVTEASPEGSAQPSKGERSNGGGPPTTLPATSQHGQETAAEHKAGNRGKAKGKGESTASKGKSKPHPASSPHSSATTHPQGGKGKAKGKNQEGAQPANGKPPRSHPAQHEPASQANDDAPIAPSEAQGKGHESESSP